MSLPNHSPETIGGATEARLEEMVPALVERLPRLLHEVRDLLSEEWPDYAQFLAEEHDEVTVAAEAFMRWLVSIAEQGLAHVPDDPVPQPGPQVALFEEIGRIQWREGRDLSTLLSAYQVGARVAWHHVSSTALATRVAPVALAALAEAVFVFIDQLSSASARGFVLEQSEAAVTRERLRDDLVELLLSDRSDSVAVRAAAVRAGWPLPREAAVILVDPENPVGQGMLARLDSSCLVIRRRALVGAIVPDPIRPGRRQRLVTALRGAGSVVGHPVSVAQLPFSMRIAELAAQLQRTGVLTDDPLFADDHLDAIIVHRDPRLLEALRRQVLAPLQAVAAGTGERLGQTLSSWLRHHGDRQAIAAELHIHPQTVRYRMTQLHDLFGPALDDPVTRARLTLTLAWGAGPDPAGPGAPAGPTEPAASRADPPIAPVRSGRPARVAAPAGDGRTGRPADADEVVGRQDGPGPVRARTASGAGAVASARTGNARVPRRRHPETG